VGRDEGENNYLTYAGADQWQFTTLDHPGPIALAAGPLTVTQVEQVAGLVALYSDGKRESQVRVEVRRDGREHVVSVAPLSRDVVDKWRI
jgi:hypothetical protein